MKILAGRGGQSLVLSDIWEGGGLKNMPIHQGGVDFFWNNSSDVYLNGPWALFSIKLAVSDLEIIFLVGALSCQIDRVRINVTLLIKRTQSQGDFEIYWLMCLHDQQIQFFLGFAPFSTCNCNEQFAHYKRIKPWYFSPLLQWFTIMWISRTHTP